MTAPLISIVIPTRDRTETLVDCLSAMRHHKSDEIEILVSDNSRSGSASAVVAEAATRDPRIRYAAFPESTSQRHSFELGLAAARGQYLALIGDDDGYVIGSLDWLADRLKRTPVDAVRWNLQMYVWPSLSQDSEGFLDVHTRHYGGGSAIFPAAPMAAKNIRGKMGPSWNNLLVYHGMIARSVYERMKAKSGGIFFAYPMTDVYSHNILPFFCRDYLQINDCISIYGMSGRSVNASWTNGFSGESQAAVEGKRWIAESVADDVGSKQPWHPEIRTLRYHDFAVFKLAEQLGMLGRHKPNLNTWTKEILGEIEAAPWQLQDWFKSEPRAAFDPEIFAAVQRAFGQRTPVSSTQDTHLLAPAEKWPSLRVRAFGPDFPDTVEGAMLAIADLVGTSTDRYEKPATTSVLGIALPSWQSLEFAKRSAINIASKINNSRVMPGFAARFSRRAFAKLRKDDSVLSRVRAMHAESQNA